MIPLRDMVKSSTTPVIVFTILALNAGVFAYQLSLDEELTNFFYSFGLVPAFLGDQYVWMSRGPFLQLMPFFTSMFLHGGWLHIIGNMWILFIFGDNVEDRMGHGRFILFYLLGGLASMALHTATNWGSGIPAIGASGAIAAVMGAYLIYYPRAKIITLLPIFFYFTIITVPAYFFLIFWFVLQFFSGAFALMAGPGGGAGIAWWAHVGGFLFGVATAKLFQKAKPPRQDVSPMARRFSLN